MPSFDIVSRVDMQEVDNAVNQALKEIRNRYDFRSSKSTIEFDKKSITLLADDTMKLKALRDTLSEKIAKRGVGVRALDFKDPEEASGSMLRQKIEIKQGISTDDGRTIVKLIKDANLKKVQAQIQQEQVRVTGPKRDDLQSVIALVKANTQLELQFVNFKD
jgi:cyclic-di-GMP-binding protein